jgi:hypothetical protein
MGTLPPSWRDCDCDENGFQDHVIRCPSISQPAPPVSRSRIFSLMIAQARHNRRVAGEGRQFVALPPIEGRQFVALSPISGYRGIGPSRQGITFSTFTASPDGPGKWQKMSNKSGGGTNQVADRHLNSSNVIARRSQSPLGRTRRRGAGIWSFGRRGRHQQRAPCISKPCTPAAFGLPPRSPQCGGAPPKKADLADFAKKQPTSRNSSSRCERARQPT